MKAVFLLSALVVAVSARPNEQYTNKFDNVPYKDIITNDRSFDGYFKCVMQEGPCTAEGKELQSHIMEAMQTNCAKCSEKQKEAVREVIGYIINHKQTQWKALCGKYDPEGKYVKMYEEELKTIA